MLRAIYLDYNATTPTENVTLIAGLGKACEIAEKDIDKNFAHIKKLRDRLESEMLSKTSGAAINGHPEHRLPNTLSISFYDHEHRS